MSTPSGHRAVVLVPTYDERENIAVVLERIRLAAPAAEILVIDDASPDGTADLAERVGERLGRVEVMRRPRKEGLGSAYRAAFAAACTTGVDRVVTIDADGSHDPAVIPTMLAHLDAGADVVIGSRYVPGGDTEHWPAHRRWLSRWGNRYTSLVLRLQVRDCTSGFRAYRAERLWSIEPSTTSAEGYAFLTELLRRLVADGAVIVERPIVFTDRTLGASKMSWRIVVESMWRVTAWALRDALTRRRPTPTG